MGLGGVPILRFDRYSSDRSAAASRVGGIDRTGPRLDKQNKQWRNPGEQGHCAQGYRWFTPVEGSSRPHRNLGASLRPSTSVSLGSSHVTTGPSSTNGYCDFSQALPDVLKFLDKKGYDAALFSLYSIVPRGEFKIRSVLRPLTTVRAVFLEEFSDGGGWHAKRFVVHHRVWRGRRRPCRRTDRRPSVRVPTPPAPPPFAEVQRLGRDQNLDRTRRPDHDVAFNARITAATVLASAPRPTRMAMPSISSSITPESRAGFCLRS